jgi:hypothetical protein
MSESEQTLVPENPLHQKPFICRRGHLMPHETDWQFDEQNQPIKPLRPGFVKSLAAMSPILGPSRNLNPSGPSLPCSMPSTDGIMRGAWHDYMAGTTIGTTWDQPNIQDPNNDGVLVAFVCNIDCGRHFMHKLALFAR